MDSPSQDFDKTAGERVEEYKMLMQNVSEYGSRRLTINAVFVGFNTIFLAALGGLLATARLDSWRTVISVALVALVITPVNLLWKAAPTGYEKGLDLRYEYIKELEHKFREYWRDQGAGLVLYLTEPHSKARVFYRNIVSEQRLATYFLILYPVIAGLVALLAFLMTANLLPSF